MMTTMIMMIWMMKLTTHVYMKKTIAELQQLQHKLRRVTVNDNYSYGPYWESSSATQYLDHVSDWLITEQKVFLYLYDNFVLEKYVCGRKKYILVTNRFSFSWHLIMLYFQIYLNQSELQTIMFWNVSLLFLKQLRQEDHAFPWYR